MKRRRTVVVGATSGMGDALARGLADDPDRDLILVGRDPDRATALATQLRSATVLALDVATYAGAQALISAVQERWDRVDVLVNNAGVMTRVRRETADGMELNLAVHHLAPFWITTGLAEQLRKSRGRVVNVNSAGHAAPMEGHGPVELDFNDLHSRRDFDPFMAYSRSKLANLLFTYELARREPHILATALHPGVVRTRLGREFPRWQVALIHATALSPRQGAGAIQALVEREDIPTASYFDRLHQSRSSAASYRAADAARLWEHTNDITARLKATR